jgi:hypothetical protein
MPRFIDSFHNVKEHYTIRILLFEYCGMYAESRNSFIRKDVRV